MDKKDYINKKIKELNNIIHELQEMEIYILDIYDEDYFLACFHEYDKEGKVMFETVCTDYLG